MFKIFRLSSDSTIGNLEPNGNNGLNPQGFCDYKIENGSIYRRNYLFTIDFASIISEVPDISIYNTASLTFTPSRVSYKTGYDNKFTIYPLSASFLEGTGYINDVNVGVSWNKRNLFDYWINGGSDYIESPSYTASLDVYGNLVFDFGRMFNDYVSGSLNDNGFVMIANTEILHFSFYGKDSESLFTPQILLKNDDVINETSGSIEFSSLSKFNDVNIFTYSHKKEYIVGEQVIIPFSFDYQFKPRTFNYSVSDYYLNNVYYDIIDASSNVPIVKDVLSDINGVNLINFNTKNFQEGKYKIRIKYTLNGNTYINSTVSIIIRYEYKNIYQ